MKHLQSLLKIRAIATAKNKNLVFPSLRGVAKFLLVALVSILITVSHLWLTKNQSFNRCAI